MEACCDTTGIDEYEDTLPLQALPLRYLNTALHTVHKADSQTRCAHHFPSSPTNLTYPPPEVRTTSLFTTLLQVNISLSLRFNLHPERLPFPSKRTSLTLFRHQQLFTAPLWVTAHQESVQLKDEMNFSIANGVWMGAAVLFILIIFFLPFVLGRQNFQRRLVTPIYNIHDFFCRLWSDPRSTLFHTTVHLIQSLCNAHVACKRWLGRFHARKLRPRLKSSSFPLLPLHRMRSKAPNRSQASALGKTQSFVDLPFDIRIIVYQHFVQLFRHASWNITNTLKADPNFVDAMAFIRTCKLVREELGAVMFQSLKFDTDAKYPFYRNLPASLTQQIRNLSLRFRPSMDVAFIHHVLLQQVHHMQAVRKLTVTVTGRVLVDLDREFEHILWRFKRAHPSLKSMTVTTCLTLATPTDDIVLSQAMTRLVTSLLPSFGAPTALRASVWTQDVGKGRFRPGTAWFCRISGANDPDWE